MDVVIFGLGQLSRHAWACLTHDSEHTVVGFTVHEAYLKDRTFMGLPVLPFEHLPRSHPPESVGLLAPTGWKRMNQARAEIFASGRNLGYQFVSYVSSRAMVWPDLTVGQNCLVLNGAMVEPFSRIGDNCMVRAGALVSHDAVIGDHCFVAARAVVAGNVRVGDSCVIGLNSTVRDDLTIARRCFVGAGAVVVANTEEGGVYLGVPAKRAPGTVEDLHSVFG